MESSSSDRSAGERDSLLLFAIVFLALTLRLVGLGRESLWYDEAFTLRFARQSFAGMNRLLVAEAWDPPVYPYLVWAWTRLVGSADWQVRLLSAIFGTLSVLALHRLARALFDLRTAHLAAFLAAVSQFLVAYSQEARCYAVLLFLVLTCAQLFVAALRDPANPKRWLALGLLSAVATLTHYYALFALLALALSALSLRGAHPVPVRGLLTGVVAFALGVLPWLASGVVASAARQPIAHFDFVAPWFSVDAFTFLRTMNDFHGGRMAGMLAAAPRWAYPAGAVLFGIPALLALSALLPGSGRKSWKSRKLDTAPLALLALLWLVPMACLIAFGFARVQFATRYVLFCVAPYLVLVARGLVGFRPGPRGVFLAAIAAWSALGLRALYTFPHKENWRRALTDFALEVRPDDGVLFLPFGEVPFEWPAYHPGGPDLEVVGLDDVERADCPRLWVLTYARVPVADPRAERARQAVLQRWRKIREKPYFLVGIELWDSPRDAAVDPRDPR